MTLAGVKKLAGQLEMEEDATEDSVTTPKVNTNNWLNKFEVVEEYLFVFRSVTGAPLSYVVREQLVPTAEADDPPNGYNTTYE